jgi:uncharacterized protein
MIREGSAVPVDDLNAPLGQNVSKKPRFAASIIHWKIIAAALAVLLVGGAAGALLAIYPIGKPAISAKQAVPEKVAPERTGSIPESQPVEVVRPQAAPPAPQPRADKPDPGATQTITIIDGTSGKREQIVVPAKPQPTR